MTDTTSSTTLGVVVPSPAAEDICNMFTGLPDQLSAYLCIFGTENIDDSVVDAAVAWGGFETEDDAEFFYDGYAARVEYMDEPEGLEEYWATNADNLALCIRGMDDQTYYELQWLMFLGVAWEDLDEAWYYEFVSSGEDDSEDYYSEDTTMYKSERIHRHLRQDETTADTEDEEDGRPIVWISDRLKFTCTDRENYVGYLPYDTDMMDMPPVFDMLDMPPYSWLNDDTELDRSSGFSIFRFEGPEETENIDSASWWQYLPQERRRGTPIDMNQEGTRFCEGCWTEAYFCRFNEGGENMECVGSDFYHLNGAASGLSLAAAAAVAMLAALNF